MTTASVPSLATRGARASLRSQFRDTARLAILDAAEATFSEHGLHGGRMEGIARRAGVAVGTLYNHFADRDALIRALIEERRREMIERVDAALRAAPADFERRLDAFVRAVFEHFERHRRFLAIVVHGEPDGSPPTLPRGLAPPTPTLTELARRAEKLMVQGIRERRLATERPQLLADLLVGMIRAALAREMLGPAGRRTSGELPKRVQRFFLQGARRA
jgi:AcrR family transcriptional regulator